MKTLLRLFKVLALASFVGVILLVGWVAISMFLDSRAGKEFAEVKMGASTQDVIALLGKPDVVRPCGENLWWGGDGDYRGKNDGRCVTEVRYEYFLSAWGVGYSADGHVVSKCHYFSE
ncbi:hypothetical protein [Methylogaea oryzae]|uniref:Uncharacterized protein n=2 Tax=Methylogaea oryzae TaxID=1295382 RepID=A0A8D5AMY8_9GAMM|nr:hypothetical protein [Methylogaea oryzae]BBL71565.1 hypothetical protein MoryE10_21710 [Methylogaea oryzae]